MFRASHLIPRRPWPAVSLGGVGGLVGYGSFLEYRAAQAEQQATTGCAVGGGIAALPRAYDWHALTEYFRNRPLSTAWRFGTISYHLLPRAMAFVRDFCLFQPTDTTTMTAIQREHAVRLRNTLTILGPAFIKAGQQLSIRPDLVPPVVLKELQKLCDSVDPVSDQVSFQVLREELKTKDLDAIFSDLRLVASASLGQVYKGRLRSTGAEVAIKIQKPNMRQSFSLDLYLLQHIGSLVDAFTSVFTNQPPFHKALVEAFASGSYLELDYVQEGANQKRFQRELSERKCPVIIPHVYDQFTTEKVLTTQWLDGVKLADASKQRIAALIPVGVELFLTQLLDMGAFHADPHPGNLLVTPEGKLCLLDFGLCAEVDPKSRKAMTKAIVHLLHRDFDALISEDAIELGFLPEDFDADSLKPLLAKVLTVAIVQPGSNLRRRKKKLMEISSELNEIFFRYPFSVPPYFALVTRGLGLLEGIALTGDPEFDIFEASVPFATRRAVSIIGAHKLRSWTFRRRQHTQALP